MPKLCPMNKEIESGEFKECIEIHCVPGTMTIRKSIL